MFYTMIGMLASVYITAYAIKKQIFKADDVIDAPNIISDYIKKKFDSEKPQNASNKKGNK